MYDRLIAIQSVMDSALRSFNQREGYLISRRLCERCINGRFAMHVQRAIDHSILKGYIVDVEWDRGMDGVEEKKKQWNGGDAYLDMVIHKRERNPETGFDNLFVVEMKQPELDFEKDKKRLITLTSTTKRFGYNAGYAIRVDRESNNLVIEDAYFLGYAKEKRLSDQFRKAIEWVKDSLDYPLLHFPNGCCGLASILLAMWLHDNGIQAFDGIQYVCGIKREQGERISHAWLDLGDVIVDITGSQFQDYHIDTCVGPMDEFHKQFTIEDKHPIIGYYPEADQKRFDRAYQSIRKKAMEIQRMEDTILKFYKIDDQIVISDKALTVGEELTVNTTDGAYEKHVPVIEQSGDTVTVKVGSVEHPMMDQHYIGWIVLETRFGFQIHYLKPGNAPAAVFKVNETVKAAYEYCNLHGLWKGEA